MLLIIPSIIIVLLLAWQGNKYETQFAIRNYKEFDSSSINGKLIETGVKHRGAFFKVENSSQSFIFYPYTDKQMNGGEIFNYFAKPGDSVVKGSFSDILHLYKGGKEYRYRFRKFGSH